MNADPTSSIDRISGVPEDLPDRVLNHIFVRWMDGGQPKQAHFKLDLMEAAAIGCSMTELEKTVDRLLRAGCIEHSRGYGFSLTPLGFSRVTDR